MEGKHVALGATNLCVLDLSNLATALQK